MPTVVLWGPPCSGKSTYIAERARPGDVVVDLDRLALALSPDGTPHHEYPEHVLGVARQARSAVVYELGKRAVSARWTAWIIDSRASEQSLMIWRSDGAQVVKLDVDKRTCIERAKAERPAYALRAIDEWFARFEREQGPREPVMVGDVKASRAW